MVSLTSGGLVKQSVVLHPDMLAKLDDLAAERQQSRADVVRDLLGRGFKQLAEEQRRLRQIEQREINPS